MTRLAKVLLVCVVSITSTVGLLQWSGQRDGRRGGEAIRVLQLKRFGVLIDTRLAEYFEHTNSTSKLSWSAGQPKLFSDNVPVDINLSMVDGSKTYRFLVNVSRRHVEAADDLTRGLLTQVRVWARAKTPQHLRHQLD